MERFQNNIQKWVELDNKSKTLNEEIRACRNQKNEIADEMKDFIAFTIFCEFIISASSRSLNST